MRALEQLLKELSPNYKIDLYTCLTVQVGNLHAMGHFKEQFPTLLQDYSRKKSDTTTVVLKECWQVKLELHSAIAPLRFWIFLEFQLMKLQNRIMEITGYKIPL